jgi:hypothetical protein
VSSVCPRCAGFAPEHGGSEHAEVVVAIGNRVE